MRCVGRKFAQRAKRLRDGTDRSSRERESTESAPDDRKERADRETRVEPVNVFASLEVPFARAHQAHRIVRSNVANRRRERVEGAPLEGQRVLALDRRRTCAGGEALRS